MKNVVEKEAKVRTRPYDASKYLESPEAQQIMLSEALETGHRGVILGAINAIARARGMTALAKQTGLARQALYAALGEDGNPTLETLLAVVNALGIRLHAEIAAEEPAERELADA